MSDRLAIVLASRDPKVLEMGLMYARNAVKQNWMTATKVYLFGPSEITAVTDPTVKDLLGNLIEEGTQPVACKFSADKHSVADALIGLGCAVEYVGELLSAAFRDGYVPMVW